MASVDPLWPRAGDWPAPQPGEGPADVALVGVPTWRTSLSPTNAHATPAAVREALRRYSFESPLRIVDVGDLTEVDRVRAIEADLLIA
jgi:formiminoglutamase